MKQIHLYIMLCISLVLLPVLVTADSQSDPVLDTALYFALTNDTIFLPNSTTDTNLQRAAIGLVIEYTKGTTDSLLSAAVVFRFDSSALEFISINKTAKWNGRLYFDTSAAPTGVLKVNLDSGKVSLDTLSDDPQSWVFADLVFKLKCRETSYEGANYTLAFAGPDTNSAIFSGGLEYYASSAHCISGAVTIANYTTAFNVVERSFTNSWNVANYVPVFMQSNSRTYSFVHKFLIDRTKYSIDSVKFKNSWSYSTKYFHEDTLIVLAYGIVPEKPVSDTLYKIWFKPDCDAVVRDAMPLQFITSESSWLPYITCEIADFGETYTSGSVTFQDSAAIEVYKDGSQPTVGKTSPHLANFKVRIKQSADIAYRNSTGISMALSWDRPSADSMAEALNVYSTSGISGGLNVVHDDYGAYDYARVFQNQPGDTLIASSSFTDRISLSFEFDPDHFPKVTWENRWIAPVFIGSIADSLTQLPLVKCASLYFRDSTQGYRWGIGTGHKFSDSILIKMAQPVIPNASTTSKNCLEQKVQIRSNFELVSCTLYVRCGPEGTIGSWSNLRSGLSVTQIDDTALIIYGTLSTPIAASDAATDLVTVKLFANSCDGTIQEVGLQARDLISKSYSSGPTEEYVCRDIHGYGRITCNQYSQMCAEDFLQYSEDSLARLSLPRDFALEQNFPNPFNPVTTISFALPVQTEWKITIFNSLGQSVKDYSGTAGPGNVTVMWDATAFSSGVYFYRAEASGFKATRKMILLK